MDATQGINHTLPSCVAVLRAFAERNSNVHLKRWIAIAKNTHNTITYIKHLTPHQHLFETKVLLSSKVDWQKFPQLFGCQNVDRHTTSVKGRRRRANGMEESGWPRWEQNDTLRNGACARDSKYAQLQVWKRKLRRPAHQWCFGPLNALRAKFKTKHLCRFYLFW